MSRNNNSRTIYLNKALSYLSDNTTELFKPPIVLTEDYVIKAYEYIYEADDDEYALDNAVKILNSGYGDFKFISGQFNIKNSRNSRNLIATQLSSVLCPANSLIVQVNNYFRIYEIEHECTLVINDYKINKYLEFCDDPQKVCWAIKSLWYFYASLKAANCSYDYATKTSVKCKDFLEWNYILDNQCNAMIEIANIESEPMPDDFNLVQFDCILGADDEEIARIKANRYITPPICMFCDQLFLLTSYITTPKTSQFVQQVIFKGRNTPGESLCLSLDANADANKYYRMLAEWLHRIELPEEDMDMLMRDIYMSYIPYCSTPALVANKLIGISWKNEFKLKSYINLISSIKDEFNPVPEDIKNMEYDVIVSAINYNIKNIMWSYVISDESEETIKRISEIPFYLRSKREIEFSSDPLVQKCFNSTMHNEEMTREILLYKEALRRVKNNDIPVSDPSKSLKSLHDQISKSNNLLEDLKIHAPKIYAAYISSKSPDVANDMYKDIRSLVFQISINFYANANDPYDYKYYLVKNLIKHWTNRSNLDTMSELVKKYSIPRDVYIDAIFDGFGEISGTYNNSLIDRIENPAKCYPLVSLFIGNVLAEMCYFLKDYSGDEIIDVAKRHFKLDSTLRTYIIVLQLCYAIKSNPEHWLDELHAPIESFIDREEVPDYVKFEKLLDVKLTLKPFEHELIEPLTHFCKNMTIFGNFVYNNFDNVMITKVLKSGGELIRLMRVDERHMYYPGVRIMMECTDRLHMIDFMYSREEVFNMLRSKL